MGHRSSYWIYWHFLPVLMQLTILFIVFWEKKLMKSLWSVIGLCRFSGKVSTAYGFTTVPFSSFGAGTL